MSKKNYKNYLLNLKKSSFLDKNFCLKGNFTGFVWKKQAFLPYCGEGANIFLLRLMDKDIYNNSETNIILHDKKKLALTVCKNFKNCIGKLYTFGLSNSSLNTYLKLGNPKYVEVFFDFSVVTTKNENFFFGIFSRVDYSYKFIPSLFKIEQSLLLLNDCFDYIHKKDIIHNDLKPNNIMCTHKNIILIDFEFALDMRKIENFNRLRTDDVNFTHPKLFLKNYNYINASNFDVRKIDLWAGVCSLFEIYHNDVLFPTHFYGDLKLNDEDKYTLFKSFFYHLKQKTFDSYIVLNELRLNPIDFDDWLEKRKFFFEIIVNFF